MNIGAIHVDNVSGGTVTIGPSISLRSGLEAQKSSEFFSLQGDLPLIRIGTGVQVGVNKRRHGAEIFRSRPEGQAAFRTGPIRGSMGGNQRWTESGKR
ncbi:MAG: hypothetical protein ACOY5W_17170 [Pseudomonadota bacterium]